MRTVVIALASIMALASIALSTAPAYAQMRGKGGAKNPGSEQQSAEQKRKAAEAEKAYRPRSTRYRTRRNPTRGEACVRSRLRLRTPRKTTASDARPRRSLRGCRQSRHERARAAARTRS